MFQFYRFIRRHTKPVPFHTAEKWGKRLGWVYLFCGWNAFLITMVAIHKSDGKLKSESVESVVERLEIPRATIIKMRSLNDFKVTEYSRAAGIDGEDFERISSSTHGEWQRETF